MSRCSRSSTCTRLRLDCWCYLLSLTLQAAQASSIAYYSMASELQAHPPCRNVMYLQRTVASAVLRPVTPSLRQVLQVTRAAAPPEQLTAECNATAPGPGCPCVPEQAATVGACAAGFICKALWNPSHAQAELKINDTARCWPCSLGQYCLAGSFLPDDPYALRKAVEQHTCRWNALHKILPDASANIHKAAIHCQELLPLQDWALLSYSRCDASVPTWHFLQQGKLHMQAKLCCLQTHNLTQHAPFTSLHDFSGASLPCRVALSTPHVSISSYWTRTPLQSSQPGPTRCMTVCMMLVTPLEAISARSTLAPPCSPVRRWSLFCIIMVCLVDI